MPLRSRPALALARAQRARGAARGSRRPRFADSTHSKPGLDHAHERVDRVVGDERRRRLERADESTPRRQPDLLVRLAQRRALERLAVVPAPAGERDLARVALEVVAAAGEDRVELAVRVAYSGTRTAESVRPWTSIASASSGASSAAEESRARSGQLDPLVEGDLALERAVHGALGGDHAQALDLLLAEVRRASA